MKDISLVVPTPLKPMLAKKVEKMPEGDWLFEPKWDGFRTLVYRDGDHHLLQSRDQRPLNRYFPELTVAVLEQLPERWRLVVTRMFSTWRMMTARRRHLLWDMSVSMR